MNKYLKVLFLIGLMVIASKAFLVYAESSNITLTATVMDTAVCGNGTVEPGESCDNGSSNGVCPATCSSLCTTNSCGGGGGGGGGETTAVCGNGIVEATEQCDDSNTSSNDGCSAVCNIENIDLGTLSIDSLTAQGSCDSATVSWQTSWSPSNNLALAGGTITYWPKGNEAAKKSINLDDYKSSQSIEIKNLQPLIEYNFTVTASASSKTASSPVGSFTTSCVLSNASVTVSAVNQGAAIAVTYPAEDNIAGLIVYKGKTTCPSVDNEILYQSDSQKIGGSQQIVYDPSIVLNATAGYTTCIKNNYNVYSSGAYGETIRTIAPAENFSATAGLKKVSLAWNNPSNNNAEDFAFGGVKLNRIGGNCAVAGINDGTQVYSGNGTSFDDNNLIPNQSYSYKIFIKNSYNEYSSGICLSAIPFVSEEVRCPSALSAVSGDSKVGLSWQNPANEIGVFNLNNIKIRRSSNCVATVTDGESIYTGRGESYTDSQVINDQLYRYTLFVDYNANKSASCGCILGQPTKTEVTETVPTEIVNEPVCSNCQTVSINPQYSFFTNSGALPIFPDASSKLNIVSGYKLLINISSDKFNKPVSLAVVEVGGASYFLTLDNVSQKYQVSFTVPEVPDDYALRITAVFDDKTQSVENYRLNVKSTGIIKEKNNNQIIGEAEIILLQNGQLVTGFGLPNQLKTTANGIYAAMVPNGQYQLIIKKDKFKTLTTQVAVSDSIINYNYLLEPELDVIELVSAIIPEKTVEQIKVGVTKVAEAIKNPTVQQANVVIAAPAVSGVAVVSTVTGMNWWNLWYLLQYLITQPLTWLRYRKRKGWGVIYNSITKKPVDLAVVRLYDATTKKLIKSMVTDRYGRYLFLVSKGSYYLEVVKRGFDYPSDILKNLEEDNQYVDLYHGGVIEVKEGKGAVIANIPIDQQDVKITDKKILSQNYWMKIRKNIAWVGPFLALVSFAITPTVLTSSLLVLQLLMLGMFKVLIERKKSSAWGVVYDEKTGRPLPFSVTRIFSPEYNRMLDYYVTDKHGRYGFLVGNNVYYLTANRDGYQEYKTSNIDLTYKQPTEVVNQNLQLKKSKTEIAAQKVVTQESSDRELTPEEEMAAKLKAQVSEISAESKPIFKTPDKEGKFG